MLTKEQIELLLSMMLSVNWPGKVLKLAAQTQEALEKILAEYLAAGQPVADE